ADKAPDLFAPKRERAGKFLDPLAHWKSKSLLVPCGVRRFFCRHCSYCRPDRRYKRHECLILNSRSFYALYIVVKPDSPRNGGDGVRFGEVSLVQNHYLLDVVQLQIDKYLVDRFDLRKYLRIRNIHDVKQQVAVRN